MKTKSTLDRIRALMHPIRGKALDALAVRINVSPATLRRIKKPGGGHNMSTVEKLARHFKIG